MSFFAYALCIISGVGVLVNAIQTRDPIITVGLFITLGCSLIAIACFKIVDAIKEKK